MIGESSSLTGEGWVTHLTHTHAHTTLEEKQQIERKKCGSNFFTELGLNLWLCSDVALLSPTL